MICEECKKEFEPIIRTQTLCIECFNEVADRLLDVFNGDVKVIEEEAVSQSHK